MDLTVVELSRLQFAVTALYHFLFVPLTIGLSIILAIMESVYVMTNKTIWRDMTKFWGILFGINFAMGVCTGVPLEFQFGTNWSYYSQFVGDIFGSLLAIEGLMAFFLEASLIGLFFFGWNRMSKLSHLIVTWLLALATNFSALWILIANAWMQNPIGSRFNPDTLRMELSSFYDVFFNPVAQSKFVHTISAGYVTGSVFVLSISAYYLLRNRHVEFAKRSMAVAASFGLASALSVVVLGDESGYSITDNQKMKMAAVEGMWETEPAPAPLTVFGIPDMDAMETHYKFDIPWVLGLIATRSLSEEVTGIKDLVNKAEDRIRKGAIAYDALLQYRKDRTNQDALKVVLNNTKNLGYGLLLKKYTDNITVATDEQVRLAALDTVPNVPYLFWSFRIMIALGFYFILLFSVAFFLVSKDKNHETRWFLWVAMFSLPLPWIAAELGWIVAEYGRQPWTIEGVLPTFLSASSLTTTSVWTTLTAFVVFYSALLIVDIILMRKYIKMGPEKALA